MIKITEDILKSVEEFKNNIQLYKEGNFENIKSFSPIMGIYKQRLTDTYMVRPRIPGGAITLEQLKGISELADKYGQGNIRFTTRQDIQFHSVKLDDLNSLLESLIKCGLTTKGAGGDGIRNVTCSPLCAVAKDEVFDVTPYVKEITNYMMKDPVNLKLPRKFKISFSNSCEDSANATVSDIGFIAKRVEGIRGFEVYAGGGLGGSAKIALKLEDFIKDTEVLYYVQAMKQVFEREGDRSNRQKARLRFVVQRLGEKEFIEMFRTELRSLKAQKDLKLKIDIKEENKKDTTKSNKSEWEKKYENIVYPQKLEGYYSLYIHPQNGKMSTEYLNKILNFLTSINYEISIRLTMTQGFFVRDLKKNDVQSLLDITSNFSSIYNIDNSISCVGPKICNFGINHSQDLLDNIIEAFKDTTVDIKTALPKIRISGCHNSCAHPQIGLIGLIGKKKRTDDGLIPVYSISFNGKVGSNIARFGEVYGEIAAKKVPKFILELASLKVNSGIIDFVEFIENKEIVVKELVTKYSSLESFSENPDLYSDF